MLKKFGLFRDTNKVIRCYTYGFAFFCLLIFAILNFNWAWTTCVLDKSISQTCHLISKEEAGILSDGCSGNVISSSWVVNWCKNGDLSDCEQFCYGWVNAEMMIYLNILKDNETYFSCTVSEDCKEMDDLSINVNPSPNFYNFSVFVVSGLGTILFLGCLFIIGIPILYIYRLAKLDKFL